MNPMHRSSKFLTEEEKNNKPNIDRAFLKRIFKQFQPYWKQFVLVFLTIVISSSLNLLPAILTGRIIDDGLIGKDLDVLYYLVGLSLVVILSANLMGVLVSYLNSWIGERITYDMRNQMFDHLQRMSHRFFTENSQGDIITRMTGDITGVRQVLTQTVSGILTNIITLVIAVIALFSKNQLLALVGLSLIPFFTLSTKKVGKKRWMITRAAQEKQDEVNEILNETLSVSGQLLVKLYNKEKKEYDKFEKANHEMIDLNIQERMAGKWFHVLLSTLTSIGPLVLYLIGGILMVQYNSNITVGDISVMVALLGKMYFPVNSLLNIQVDWIRSMALFTRIFEYFDMEIEIDNPQNPIINKDISGNLKFNNVNFHYSPTRRILKNISFELKSGRSIAIVGTSGAGKTSLINLIPRLYDITGGSIELDGIDIRDLDLYHLRSNIGMVTQDTYLFNDTIRENLLYAKEDATEEEITDACKKANIHDFIISQDKGYDTTVGNRGLKLSGGEKQRLSIARVLLKDPTILIFDEATSSLDSISESLIQTAIEPLIDSKTSILIAHRLSTVLAADEILVMEDGEIIERGTHRELIEQNGVYNKLYETQFKESIKITEA